MLAKNGFYPRGTKDDLRVISFGIPRSGSTFIYQVLCDLFAEGVAKTHGYMDKKNVPVVMTYRDLRDCILSLWLVRGGGTPIPHKKINWIWLHEVKPSYEALRRYEDERSKTYGNATFAMLRYEEFTTRPMQIWAHINPAIVPMPSLEGTGRQEAIVAAHSKEKNAEIAKQYKGFGQYDRESHIHGNHMAGGGIGAWQQNADCTGRQILTELTREANEHLGYKVA